MATHHIIENVLRQFMKTSFIKVLIPNGPSVRNLGDAAILNSLVNLIHKSYPAGEIIVHAMEPHLYRDKNYHVDSAIYDWAIFQDRGFIPRIIKLFILCINYLSLKCFKHLLITTNSNFNKIVNDYKNADLIILIGGGYLRSKAGLTQNLNLFMLLAMFAYAKLFSAKTIVAPISIGPFRHKWHEKLVVYILKQMDTVMVREDYSLKLLVKYKLNNVISSPDLALLAKYNSHKKIKNQKYILGFTVRNWLPKNKQLYFENALANAIIRFSKKVGGVVQPIVQVDAASFQEDDVGATKRITKYLKNHDINVLPIEKNQTLNSIRKTYSKIDLLLGMRMHSNILAALAGTPFVAISYEYKTEGIAKQLRMEKYVIKCQYVDENNLYRLLINAYHRRDKMIETVDNALKIIQKRENRKWNMILKKLLHK